MGRAGTVSIAVAESGVKTIGDFGLRRRMVLAALMCNLDRPHQAGEAARGRPIHIIGQTVQHAGAERIAAAGGVDYPLGAYARDIDALAAAVNFSAEVG